MGTGQELHLAVSEALAFLDQSLDAGFRPGMGNVVPDRFFWALPPGDEEAAAAADGAEPFDPNDLTPPGPSRNVH